MRRRLLDSIIVIVLLLLLVSCKKDGDFNVVMDVDGNFYHTVTIGTQMWMAENLKTTRYNDGTEIPNITNAGWKYVTTGTYRNYNDDENYVNRYGRLYNWYAVKTGKLAPKGWHVATEEDWNTLTDYLGGDSLAGGKLKEATTLYWEIPNVGATNETGFNALPGGDYASIGDNCYFHYLGYYGFWWSSAYDEEFAHGRFIYSNSNFIYSNLVEYYMGFSVRCVKDK